MAFVSRTVMAAERSHVARRVCDQECISNATKTKVQFFLPEERKTGTFENEIFQRKGTKGTGQRGTKVRVGKVSGSDTLATCSTQLICAHSNCLG